MHSSPCGDGRRMPITRLFGASVRAPLAACVWGILLSACSNDVDFASGDKATQRSEDASAAAEEAGLQSFEQSFPAARIENMSLTVDPTSRWLTQTLTLRELPAAVASYLQAERRLVLDDFTQGHDAGIAAPETFSVASSALLDLLVVIDDSPSMVEEAQNLSTKLDPLLSSVGSTDWQIAVVTTSDPCLRGSRLIKKGDKDAAAAFASAVTSSLTSGVEKGFPVAIRALRGECNGNTAPWLRSEASLAILIVSDEDNCGSNSTDSCAGEEGETVQQMLNFLAKLRPAGDAKIYGIFEGPGNPCSAAYEAKKYKQAVEQTGGTWGSICDSNYTSTLKSISSNISSFVTRRFELTHAPDLDSLVVTIDGRTLGSGYVLKGKVLSVNNVSLDDKNITVTYRYGAMPKFQSIALSDSADPSTLKIQVNGKNLGRGLFEYDADNRLVTFKNEPADNAKVTAQYRSGAALPKSLQLKGADVLAGSVQVKVNGKAMKDVQYVAADKSLAFAVPPPDGATIEVSYRTPEGLITQYPLSLAADQKFLFAKDAATGEAVDVRIEQDTAVVAPEDIVNDRKVVLAFDRGHSTPDFSFDLGSAPMEGSIAVRNARGEPVCVGEPVVVGTVVTLNCAVDESEVSVSYDRLVERYDSFELPGDFDAEAVKWQVFVDDAPVLDFVRTGKTISVPMALLGARSSVRILAMLNP